MPYWRLLLVAALAGAAISCSRQEPAEAPQASKPEPEPTEEAKVYRNRVSLKTSAGEIILELDPEKAPLSVANFLNYLDQGHYDGTVFHRVIDGYLIEAGSFGLEDDQMSQRTTGSSIRNEADNGLRNLRGSVAMARNAQPDSATSAFFINLADNLGLDHPQPDGHGYAVFGKVVTGLEVVETIGRSPTDIRPLIRIHPGTGEKGEQMVPDVPLDPVVIQSAERIIE